MDSNSEQICLLHKAFSYLQVSLRCSAATSNIKIRLVEQYSLGYRTVTFFSLKRWLDRLLSMRYPAFESYELFFKIYDDYEQKRLLSQYSYSIRKLPAPADGLSDDSLVSEPDEEDFFLF